MPSTESKTIAKPTNKARRKAFLGAIVGHLIEWYDYGIYGFLAVYVGANFFASDDPAVGTISAFAVFALSFFIRPVGGMFFGPLADRVGRRKTLLLVISLMCGSTMLIGALPTMSSVGIAAPILLVLLRLIQGLSAGGEVSTVTAFISEYSKPEKRGFSTSLVLATAGVGLLLGAVVGNGITWMLGTEAMTEWGWRIPFLIAGPLGVVAVFIRLKLEDSPEFRDLQEKDMVAEAPLREVFRYPRQLLLMAAVITFLASGFYLVYTYFSTYLKTSLEFSPGRTFFYVLLAGIIGVVLMPISGMITDKLGSRRNFLLVVLALWAAAIVWFFSTAPSASPTGVLLPLIAVAVGMGLYCGSPYATMSELMPARVRSTGIALGYNIPVALFGGSAPLIASALIRQTGDISSPMYFFLATAVVSAVGLLFLRDKDLLGSDRFVAETTNSRQEGTKARSMD